MSIFIITSPPPSNEYSVSIKVQTRGIRSIYKKNFNTREKIYNGKKKYSPNRGHKKDRESPHSAIYVYRQFEFPRRPRFYQSPVPREITHTITRASRAIYNSYNRRAMIPDVKDLSERGRGEESKNFFSIN